MFQTLAPSLSAGPATSSATGGRADNTSPFSGGGFNVSFGGQSANALPLGTQPAAGWPGLPTAATYTADPVFALPSFSSAPLTAKPASSGLTLSPGLMVVGAALLLLLLRRG